MHSFIHAFTHSFIYSYPLYFFEIYCTHTENISLTAAVKTLEYFLYDLKSTIFFVDFKTVYSMLSNADGMEFPERAWVLRRCEQGSEPRPSSAVMFQALFKWEV